MKFLYLIIFNAAFFSLLNAREQANIANTGPNTAQPEATKDLASEQQQFSADFLDLLLVKGYRNPVLANKVRLWSRNRSGFNVIDNKHIILRSRISKYHLLEFKNNCSNLKFDPIFYFDHRYSSIIRKNDIVKIIDRFDFHNNFYRRGYHSFFRPYSRFHHIPKRFCRIENIYSLDRLSLAERKQLRLERKQQKQKQKQKSSN